MTGTDIEQGELATVQMQPFNAVQMKYLESRPFNSVQMQYLENRFKMLDEKIDKFIDDFKKDEGEFWKPGVVCYICLETFCKGRAKSMTLCKHTFHKDCLCKWKKQCSSKSCPVCRRDITLTTPHP